MSSATIGFQTSPGGGGGGVPGAQSADGGLVALAASDVAKAVVFGATFTAKPAVTAKIISPAGATEVVARIDYSTLTTAGMTVRFVAIPASGYYLSWSAIGS